MKSRKTANKQADNYLNRIIKEGGEINLLYNGFTFTFKNGSFLRVCKYEPYKKNTNGLVLDTKRKNHDYTVEFWSGKKLGNTKNINCTNLRAKKIFDLLKQKYNKLV